MDTLMRNEMRLKINIAIFGLLFMPLMAFAMPKHANSNPEKLIGAILIGEDFSKLPKPTKPLNNSPDVPNNEICSHYDIKPNQILCEYIAKDGIIYAIHGTKIISVEMKPDEKGKWPKALPFGVKKNDKKEKIYEILNGFHLIPLSDYMDRHQKKFSFIVYETRNPKGKEVWFSFDDNGKLNSISILKEQPEP